MTTPTSNNIIHEVGEQNLRSLMVIALTNHVIYILSNPDLRELDLLTRLELGPEEFMSSRAHEHLILFTIYD